MEDRSYLAPARLSGAGRYRRGDHLGIAASSPLTEPSRGGGRIAYLGARYALSPTFCHPRAARFTNYVSQAPGCASPDLRINAYVSRVRDGWWPLISGRQSPILLGRVIHASSPMPARIIAYVR